MATPAEIIRKTRGKRSLRQFAIELGVVHQAVDLWEKGGGLSMDTLAEWWADDREWVQNMAVEIMAAQFPGLIRAKKALALGAKKPAPKKEPDMYS